MKKLHLRYVGSVTPITGILDEHYEADAATVRDLLNELEVKYGGFHEMFLEEETGELKLNAMIYYREQGKTPMAAIDLDQPIRDGAEITFW
jgi:molybdopterin converting factor small subunit